MSPISLDTPPATPCLADDFMGASAAAVAAKGPLGRVTGIRIADSSSADRNELFGPQGRRSTLVAAYPELDFVCSALGFGHGLTLGEWSASSDWVLVILARSARPPRSSQPERERDWTMATIPELIADIVATHHVPLRHELERLGIIIDHLAAAQQHAVFSALRKAYHEFKDALALHLDQEECELFPLCIAQEEALSGRGSWEDHDITSLIRFNGHGHVECQSGLCRLMGLLQATSIFRNPDIAVVSDALYALSRDLAVHTAKEGQILFPAAIFSEELLRTRHVRPLFGANEEK